MKEQTELYAALEAAGKIFDKGIDLDMTNLSGDIMVIKEMMGHSNVATTERYLHGFEGQLQLLFDTYKK